MIWRKPGASQANETDAVNRVLVIQLGRVGAFVQSLAAAKHIRAMHVGARITLLTTEATRELAEKCPYFDAVEADGKPKEAQAITQLIARIRAAKYDMIYDLEGSNRTNNYFQGMRPWPPRWSGPVSGCSHPYPSSARADLHPLDRYSAQMSAAGLGEVELLPDLSWLRPVMRDPPRLQPEYFSLRGPYVLLLPRGGDVSDRWPEANYAELAGRLARQGVTPVVLGGSEERAIGAAAAKAEPRTKNLVGRADLFQCIALAERAEAAMGDDGDMMQLAAGAGAACLVLLSSQTLPERAAPRGRGGVVTMMAFQVADLPPEQVERQLRNFGLFRRAASA
jgi:ADP-heptose:LPS heptosyltransferase